MIAKMENILYDITCNEYSQIILFGSILQLGFQSITEVGFIFFYIKPFSSLGTYCSRETIDKTHL